MRRSEGRFFYQVCISALQRCLERKVFVTFAQSGVFKAEVKETHKMGDFFGNLIQDCHGTHSLGNFIAGG
jgi:hypothetical protein